MNALPLAGRLICSACLFGAAPLAAQVTWPVTFNGSASALTVGERAQLTSHFQEAGRRWAAEIEIAGPRSIEIEIGVDNAIARINGRSETSFFFGVFGGRDTFEQGAARELRAGIDPNGATRDVIINVNLTYLRTEMWFDPNPIARIDPVPVDRTDAMSLALHELGHALAYNGFANGTGVPPATFWSTFDRWIIPGTPPLFDGPLVVPTWGSRPDLTTNNYTHWGNAALQAQTPAKLAAPVLWREGAPVPQAHCDGPLSIDAPPPGSAGSRQPLGGTLIDGLMNGVVFIRGSRYTISSLDRALLSDAGLPLDTNGLFANGFEP